MRTLKTALSGLLFAGLIFFGLAAVSFADGHSQQDIQTLKDAAAALRVSNPGLGSELGEYADKEAGENKEAEGKEENEEDERGGVKLLNEAASVLQQSNPSLAEALKKYAGKEAQEE